MFVSRTESLAPLRKKEVGNADWGLTDSHLQGGVGLFLDYCIVGDSFETGQPNIIPTTDLY